MILYSQHDPAYDRLHLGTSPLTVHQAGCFLCSIATIYQQPVIDLLKVNAFTDTGDLVSGLLAKYCGGVAAAPSTVAPQGWCIAQTDHYAPQFPTHFFCLNPQAKVMIDPLDFPAVVKPLRADYRILNYRSFTNIKLPAGTFSVPETLYPDVPFDRWSAYAIKFCNDAGLMKGYEDGLFRPTQPVSREELASVIMRLKM